MALQAIRQKSRYHPMNDMPVDQKLFNVVRDLLVAKRTLTAKTATAIVIQLDVDDAITGLNSDAIAQLEEYEAELLLSPLFTPNSEDKAECEAALSPSGITTETLNSLFMQLTQEKLSCQVVYGLSNGTLTIPDIIVERYLRLLGLTGKISDSIVDLLEAVVDSDNRNRAFSLARRPVWNKSTSSDVLAICLEKMQEKNSFSLNKMNFLTEFVRTYRPTAQDILLTNLNNMVTAYHKDKDHPVYNRNLQKKQEKSLMPLSCNTEVRANRMAMADALLSDFNLETIIK
ncbi:MAG: hypothetical protein HQL69_00365 [Magnetococcales bacterium]|nr:hypothetical protein [Magnetococcales bacterium]